VFAELGRRFGISGIDEKASRAPKPGAGGAGASGGGGGGAP